MARPAPRRAFKTLRARASRARARLSPSLRHHGEGPFALRRLSGTWHLARVQQGVAPALQAQRIADEVRAVLDQAGVDHAVTSVSDLRGTELAIAEADWTKAVVALREASSAEVWYLTDDGGSARRGLRRLDDVPLAKVAEEGELSIATLVADRTSGKVYGSSTPCRLVRWSPVGGVVVPAEYSVLGQYVDAASFADRTDVVSATGVVERRLRVDAAPKLCQVTFPIDLVYLWVDGGDPEFRARLAKHRPSGPDDGADEAEATAPWRFRDREELRFSLRSIEMYAPWFRNVVLVTDHQVPTWLDVDNPRLRVVFHDEFFADPSVLPVFNSHAIGAQLHRIEGLSEHFLIFNDDVLLNANVGPEAFFTPGGAALIKRSRVRWPIAPAADLLEIESARLNTARLVEAEFGLVPNQLFGHTPVPQRVSVGRELEARYPREFARTAASRFRSPDDIEPNSWLQLNYLDCIGQAAPSRVAYEYFNLGEPLARRGLPKTLRADRIAVVCLNDGPSEDGVDYTDWLVRSLKRWLPRRSSFELPTDRHRGATAWPGPAPLPAARPEA